MSAFIEAANGWSHAWFDLMWAIVWQSTAIAGVAGVAAFFVSRRPALCYWVWQVVAIKLLLMPLWTANLPLPANLAPSRRLTDTSETAPVNYSQAGAPQGEKELAAGHLTRAEYALAAPQERPLVRSVSWTLWLALVWGAVILWRVGRILRQRLALGRLLARAASASNQPISALVVELARQLKLPRVPAVLLTDCECSPFVCGVSRPKLVLPGSLLDSLTAGQLREVLLHELAHVQRYDLVFGWAHEIACLAYWFHPVAHFVSSQVQLQRELACDQIAISQSGHWAAGYAQTLVQIVSHASRGGLFPAAAASR